MDSLKIRDITHFCPNFDPFTSATPYDFAEHGLPLPFCKDFYTPETFRSFWEQERLAYQWIYISEKHSRTFYSKDPPLDGSLPVARTNATGRPPLYDWSIKYACRHSGCEKTLSIARNSVPQGCLACIRIRKLRAEDRVRIEYYWEHSHATNLSTLATYPPGPNERNWAKKMVKEGEDWHSIKKKLTPSAEQLARLESSNGTAPLGPRITYENIRKCMYRYRTLTIEGTESRGRGGKKEAVAGENGSTDGKV
ncbi:hypothetical protein BC939DRAFT_441115 [Gamsiella multidivaricata]|uniref:uncharacterized protein n=1 Tax=Gamsiella multidivaricata TaxID=101098 RepID=UPI00221F5831|nr:uncharacterized protein BC939DRAFT_441115 [Gamsiella multidivaricata]KAI7829567.1 hypothetical protein BC939DRAFT_441115 [Gamsiella multidivaricata]